MFLSFFVVAFFKEQGRIEKKQGFYIYLFIYFKRSKEFSKRSKFSKSSMEVSKRNMVGVLKERGSLPPRALPALEFRRVKCNYTADEFVEKLWSVDTVL